MDTDIRGLLRKARAGDIDAAIQYAYSIQRTGSDILESHRASLGEDGPDLCIVPVTNDVIHVQIGQTGSRRSQREDSGIATAGVFTMPDHPVESLRRIRDIGAKDVRTPRGTRTAQAAQEQRRDYYTIRYTPCDQMRGLFHGRTKITGSATFFVDHQKKSVVCISRPHGIPNLIPRQHGEQVGRDLLVPLTSLVARWVTDNPLAMDVAGRQKIIGKALKAYEMAQDHAEDARLRVEATRQSLFELIVNDASRP